MRTLIYTTILLFCFSTSCFAGGANVLKVKVEKTGGRLFQIWVTVQHDDEGWDHYVNKWEIYDVEGNLLDTRVLEQPHTAEPFTSSIEKANIPRGVKRIRVRAHDNVHGYEGKDLYINLP